MSEKAKSALQQLLSSVLFAEDFPKRSTSTGGSQAAERPALAAVKRVGRAHGPLVDLIRTLGRERYAPATPALCRLWRDCAHTMARTSAGRALFEIATEEAWDALLAALEEDDDFSRSMATKVMFARHPTTTFDLFEARRLASAGGVGPVALSLLGYLRSAEWRPCRDATRRNGAEEALRLDSRWLEASARLRHDPHYGSFARDILRKAPTARLAAALALARTEEARAPGPEPARTRRFGDLRRRYEAGAFQEVWREIRSYPRIDGEFRAEVLEVAEATMRRVAQNVDLISDRLRTRGWRALQEDRIGLRTPPSPGDSAIIAQITEIAGGAVPPTLLAFWRVVGGVNWIWDYTSDREQPELGVDLPMDEMDPLSVDPPKTVTHLIDEWLADSMQPDPDLLEPLYLELAPDQLCKANISGGGPYCIAIPFAGADPVFEDGWRDLPFVDYLRLAFRWAGFPGLADHGERPDVRRFVQEFGRGLAPF